MSEHVQEYKNDLDEIVFEHRNKAYGAYDLRKSYRGILTKALIIGVLLFTFGVVAPFVVMKIKQMNKPDEIAVDANMLDLTQPEDEDEIFVNEPEPEPEEPEPEPEIEEQVEVIQNIVPEPTKKPKNEVPPPKMSEQKKTLTGDKNQKGVKKPNAFVPPKKPKNPGKGKAVNTKPPVDNKKIYKTVDQEATFPGGDAWLREYVLEEFDTSVLEEEEDIVRTVVHFVIEKDGRMTGVRAEGGPADFKREAINVMKSIRKKWKPAKVNGKPVRCYGKFPISMRPPEF
ncbi:MAG: energy transducer TonB [Flavobacteriales bacterium]|nr:MAG: energy transducer TonB [Flavobacteriales bacterium]